MDSVETIMVVRHAVAAARRAGKTIGLVPTMGALHAGHTSLMDAARVACDFVVVSIFVNPTQFGPQEDLEAYPRPLEDDLALCRDHGADLVFIPSVDEMYGRETLTHVEVTQLTEPLCGEKRPGHFHGVTTVCTKLFNIVQADQAFFGQKDAQQTVVIKRLVADLNFPLEIVVCPTVRARDGLAISSRNRYLNTAQRHDATHLYRSLCACRRAIEQGERQGAVLERIVREILEAVPSLEVEYVAVVDADTLTPVKNLTHAALVAVAAKLGSARLIDNIVVDVTG
ncbi:pantoate--beta-alanine ligase [Planctomycetota bacterium]